MRSPLALFLSIALNFNWSCGTFGGSTAQKAGLSENAGQVAVNGCETVFSGGEDCVGMLDVRSRKVLDARLEGGECDDNLIIVVSKCLIINVNVIDSVNN